MIGEETRTGRRKPSFAGAKDDGNNRRWRVDYSSLRDLRAATVGFVKATLRRKEKQILRYAYPADLVRGPRRAPLRMTILKFNDQSQNK
jgi:hypothetical protein